MELTWFRRPAGDDPGSLNACFSALDVHVIRGRADETAVRAPQGEVSLATLLEQVAALAGAYRTLGADVGTVVGVRLADPYDALLALLACLRIGAVHVALAPETDAARLVDLHQPGLLLTDTVVEATHVPAASILHGLEPTDHVRELAWGVALSAGRIDPAPCVDLPPSAPAYVVGGQTVPHVEAAEHDGWAGQACARLCAGELLEVGADA